MDFLSRQYGLLGGCCYDGDYYYHLFHFFDSHSGFGQGPLNSLIREKKQ